MLRMVSEKKRTDDEAIREQVAHALAAIAPEADLTSLRTDTNLREELDIDSMDFLIFVVALHKRLHVDISAKDYPMLNTQDGCLAYLGEALRMTPPVRK